MGDLILAEVLQGFTRDSDFNRAREMLRTLVFVELGGEAIAIEAARNFRTLRGLGLNIRKSIDCIIATWCIHNDCWLLHSDRDFEPFVAHLNLKTVTPQKCNPLISKPQHPQKPLHAAPLPNVKTT